MKKIIRHILMGLAVLLPAALFSDTPAPLGGRPVVINFQGQLVDSAGRPYDGPIDIEARFYNSPARETGSLVYAEEFVNIDVDHGIFRVPLLGGTALEGTSPSIDSFSAQAELYVDIKVDSIVFLEAWPIGSQFAAIRAEKAVSAENLRQPISLSPSDIPQHRADLISSGTLKVAQMPSIPSGKIIGGTFATEMISSVDAGKVTTGSFGTDAFQTGISADKFQNGTLADSVIPYETMGSHDFGIAMGEAPHGTAIQIPEGFNRNQCTWIVSVKRSNLFYNDAGLDHMQVLTDANGVVTCLFDVDTGDGIPQWECTANYLTICKK